MSVPNVTEIHAAPADDEHVENQRKKAAILSAGLIVGLSALSRDVSPYVLGGVTLVGLDWVIRHANAVNPVANRVQLHHGGEEAGRVLNLDAHGIEHKVSSYLGY
jgi:hypothetical protein